MPKPLRKQIVLKEKKLALNRTREQNTRAPCKKAVAQPSGPFATGAVGPEVMGGLPTPRPASEIQADGRLVNILGKDVTAEYHRGAEAVLALAREHGATVAILKEKSPACGKGRIYDGSFTGTLRDGNGVCAELLLQNGIRVLGETEREAIENL